MNREGQLLLMAGLLMTLTVLTVTLSISHSVNLGLHQGERHDLSPLVSMLDAHLPPAVQAEYDRTSDAATAFDAVAADFEDRCSDNGYLLVVKRTGVANGTVSYSTTLTDGVLTLTLNRTLTLA